MPRYRCPYLDGHHPGGGVGQQLAVVADVQHGLGRGVEALLEPALAGYVEEVVRLVEQQHFVRAPQQRLEHEPLLLATGQGGQVAVLCAGVRHPERRGAAGVPQHLGVIAAGVGVLRQRGGIAHLDGLVVALHQGELDLVDQAGCRAYAQGRDREQQVAHRPVVVALCHHLPHHPEATATADGAAVRRQVSGHDAQQRGLAGTVGPHQSDLGAVADSERDVVEQYPPVRQLETHSGQLHVTHERRL
jgi:hypothetical protein